MDHSDRQATKKTPKNKFTSVSPSFKGKKSKNFDRQAAKKKLASVSPPSGVLKSTIPIGKRPEKRPKKNEHSAAFIARQQTGGILSHVRRTFGLGAKIHEENPQKQSWPFPHLLRRRVELKTRSVGSVTGNARKGLGLSGGLLFHPCPRAPS